MSYILDALKKSDEQRQSDARPSVVSTTAPYMITSNKQSRSRIGWLIVILLLIAIAAGIAWQQSWLTFARTNPLPAVSIQNQEPVNSPAQPAAEPRRTTGEETQTPPVVNRLPAKRVMELWEISAGRQAQLEAFSFSFHVYSDNPSKRTIIIDGRRLFTGEQIDERWVLQEITQNGVIVKDDSGAVLLKVVEGW